MEQYHNEFGEEEENKEEEENDEEEENEGEWDGNEEEWGGIDEPPEVLRIEHEYDNKWIDEVTKLRNLLLEAAGNNTFQSQHVMSQTSQHATLPIGPLSLSQQINVGEKVTPLVSADSSPVKSENKKVTPQTSAPIQEHLTVEQQRLFARRLTSNSGPRRPPLFSSSSSDASSTDGSSTTEEPTPPQTHPMTTRSRKRPEPESGGKRKKLQTRKHKKVKKTKKMVKKNKNKKQTKKHKYKNKRGTKKRGGKGILKVKANDPYNRMERGLSQKTVKNVSFRNQVENNRNFENLNRAEKGLPPVTLPIGHKSLKSYPQERTRIYSTNCINQTNPQIQKLANVTNEDREEHKQDLNNWQIYVNADLADAEANNLNKIY